MKFNLIKKMENGNSFIAQYLSNRGVTESPDEFFDLSWADVQDPTNLDQIEEGVGMLIKHLNADSKIAILVDVDTDGYTSSALLFNYMTFMMEPGRPWEMYGGEIVPVFHKDKTHGLGDTDVMKRLRDEIKPNLLIIPDASGTEEQCAALVALGIDILIIDHHDMEFRGDKETVVVINNQQSERYLNKDLSGVGVVFQFCCMLDNVLGWDAAGQWLDLVACGMVGDMMNLKSRETRFLIFQGLNNITSYLLQFYKFTAYNMQGKDYNPHAISFEIAPKVNAVCRIGTMEERELLWKAFIDIYAEDMIENGTRGHKGEMVPLVQEALRVANNAKGRADRRKNKLVEKIHTIIHEEDLINHKVLVFGFDDYEEEYRALSGVTANALAEYYQRPVIITFKVKNDYVGSMRVPDTDNPIYKNFKDQCEESGYCTFVAGHQEAAGIGIQNGFIEDLIEYFDNKYEGQDTDLMYNVDFVIDANDPNLVQLISEMNQIKNIHGQGLKAPRIAVINVKISPSNLRLVGQKSSTLWITCPNCKFINFRSSREEYNSLRCPVDDSGVETYYTATIIGDQPDLNEWNNTITPQMQIVDYEVNTTPHYEF